jgi:tetratricopeptide (TPR) repeat protein
MRPPASSSFTGTSPGFFRGEQAEEQKAMSILPDRYRDPERVGLGGMGEIYRAEDTVLGRVVAIKLLAERYAADDAVRGRFTREGLAAARLSGEPHTITIFDVGEHGGRPFIVMEYLHGGSLEDRLRDGGAQDPAHALNWLEEAAAALDAAHGHGVVHRDVKPGNLLLAGDGTVRVADFGVASAAGLDSLTVTGTVLGTAGYLAPEQARGEPTTPASDLYALAVVAFELLTGRRPYEGESPTAEAAAHVHAEIPAISEHGDFPPEADAVFERALAKDPADRYRSNGEFVRALREALRAGAVTTRELPAAWPEPERSRLPIPALLGGVLIALALAGAGLAAVLTQDDESSAPDEITITRTAEGTTVRETITQEATTTAAPPPPPPQPPQPPAAGDPVELTDRATALLKAGRYAEALPLAQQALRQLSGSGETYEGYANYNVGRSLVGLGRCDEAIPYLRRREQLLGRHPDVTSALRECGVR